MRPRHTPHAGTHTLARGSALLVPPAIAAPERLGRRPSALARTHPSPHSAASSACARSAVRPRSRRCRAHPRLRSSPPAAKIQNDLRILTERLARINDNLARKISSRNEYDKTIQETEAAYAKVGDRTPAAAASRVPTPAGRPSPPPPCRFGSPSRALASCRPPPSPPRPDHGVVANAAARAEARVGQPHKEEAGLVVRRLRPRLGSRTGAGRGGAFWGRAGGGDFEAFGSALAVGSVEPWGRVCCEERSATREGGADRSNLGGWRCAGAEEGRGGWGGGGGVAASLPLARR